MKILLKFPVRARAEKFIEVLRRYYMTCQNPDNITLLVSIDDDDEAFTPEVIEKVKAFFTNTIVKKGKAAGKINACNRDMDAVADWDIVVLASDDMIPQMNGWDEQISMRMPFHLDAVLWFNDGYLGEKLNTMCILGWTYYNRFKYIYCPEYQSLWCDNEFMDVANILGKQTYYHLCLFKHEHFSTNKKVKPDELMQHNQSFYFTDGQTYKKRKAANFFLNV